ncbi:MAG TPA: acetate--CoA ligase family protein, partial [Mycobacteriales bacterium]|nr:acetate--CoA ligase family protein [Mycobacteriales bacterium]
RAGTGYGVVHNLRRTGYEGQVACVNPKYDEIDGFPCYPSLEDVPFVPDVAVLAVGTERVVPMVEAAVAKGATGAVVFAFGFAEGGEEGRALQQRMRELTDKGEMALVGPNCQGLVNFVDGVPLYMDAVHPYDAGRVALIAQSGSVATALINNRRGVRWSHAVSSGNEAVTDAAAILEYYVQDSRVDVICAFLETIRRPDVFFAQCDLARSLGKPVIICKSGRTTEAQAAATAHTGALAVPDRLVDAALRRHDVIRVDTLEELLETAVAMQSPRRPKGGGMAVLTASGGQIELVHDHVPGTGLSIPAFAPETVSGLRELIAEFLPATNPLDWWGTADYDNRVPSIATTAANDPSVDILVQVGDFTVGPTGDEPRSAGSVAASRVAHSETDRLCVVLDGVGGAPTAADTEGALAEGVLVLSGFDTGLRALGHLVRYSAPSPAVGELPPVDVAGIESVLSRMASGPNGGPLALELLAAAGVTVAPHEVAKSAEEADAACARLRFPLVAKIADEEVAHKTEHGGVILGIDSEVALAAAVTGLLERGARGVLVQEQISGGTEFILGLHAAPPLGTFLLAGFGGVWTELVDDVQVRATPLRTGDAGTMLAALRGYARLTGARGSTPVDLAALERTIGVLDALAAVLGDRITSLDVNPLILSADGAIAVDALLVKV